MPGFSSATFMGIRANCWFLPQRARSSAAPLEPDGRHCPGRVIGGQLLSAGSLARRYRVTSHELVLATAQSRGDVAVDEGVGDSHSCTSPSGGLDLKRILDGAEPEGLIVVGTQTDTRNTLGSSARWSVSCRIPRRLRLDPDMNQAANTAGGQIGRWQIKGTCNGQVRQVTRLS